MGSLYTQSLHRLDTVHLGHHMIHEDDIVIFAGTLCDRRFTAVHGINDHSVGFENSSCNEEVHGLIIDDKNLNAGTHHLLMSLNKFVINGLIQEVCYLNTVEGLGYLSDLASGIDHLVTVKNDRDLNGLGKFLDILPVFKILTGSDKQVADM